MLTHVPLIFHNHHPTASLLRSTIISAMRHLSKLPILAYASLHQLISLGRVNWVGFQRWIVPTHTARLNTPQRLLTTDSKRNYLRDFAPFWLWLNSISKEQIICCTLFFTYSYNQIWSSCRIVLTLSRWVSHNCKLKPAFQKQLPTCWWTKSPMGRKVIYSIFHLVLSKQCKIGQSSICSSIHDNQNRTCMKDLSMSQFPSLTQPNMKLHLPSSQFWCPLLTNGVINPILPINGLNGSLGL